MKVMMAMTTTEEFKKGDKVRVTGEHGVYVVHRTELFADGSLLLFGGSTNPNGKQKFRSVMPSRVSHKKG